MERELGQRPPAVVVVSPCRDDFIAKMDVDLELTPIYVETLLAKFAADPRLGGAICAVWHNDGGALVREFSSVPESIVGCFKFYRREVFERIGGFVRAVMWDGIAFHAAGMEGFRTRSLPDAALRIVHRRVQPARSLGIPCSPTCL